MYGICIEKVKKTWCIAGDSVVGVLNGLLLCCDACEVRGVAVNGQRCMLSR